MDARLDAVKQRIVLLSVIDTDRQVFGAATHQYQLAPPLTGDELGVLERELAVQLPDEVRQFLRKVGAAGAGPHYGLVRIHAKSEKITDGGAPRHRASRATLIPGVPGEELLRIADQGCGMSSLLVISGPNRGAVLCDPGEGPWFPEAPSFVAWYEQWLDRALIEWAERAAPRLALDGPQQPAELEAAALAIDILTAIKHPTASQACALGYLHLREHRFGDADAAFVVASRAPDPSDLLMSERDARLHRDRANIAYVRDDFDAAIKHAKDGLAITNIWFSTADELREILERSLHAAGRPDEALHVLETRAAEAFFDFALHHRLATEHLARHNVKAAIAALERAADMRNIGGPNATQESRVKDAFQPIIDALRTGGRTEDADQLATRMDVLLNAN